MNIKGEVYSGDFRQDIMEGKQTYKKSISP